MSSDKAGTPPEAPGPDDAIDASISPTPPPPPLEIPEGVDEVGSIVALGFRDAFYFMAEAKKFATAHELANLKIALSYEDKIDKRQQTRWLISRIGSAIIVTGISLVLIGMGHLREGIEILGAGTFFAAGKFSRSAESGKRDES